MQLMQVCQACPAGWQGACTTLRSCGQQSLWPFPLTKMWSSLACWMYRVGVRAYPSVYSLTHRRPAGLTYLPSWGAKSLKSTITIQPALCIGLPTNRAVEEPSISDVWPRLDKVLTSELIFVNRKGLQGCQSYPAGW